MSDKQIVEINGIKMELDYREGTTTRIDTYRVGSKVKVLTKGYGDSYNVRPGVIVGFDEFKALPTIVIMCIGSGYGSGVEYVGINAKTENIELISAEGDQELMAKRDDILATLQRGVELKRVELEQAEYNLKQFHRHFNEVVPIKEPSVK